MRWRGVARVVLCLAAAQTVQAAYTCTSTGTECANQNYGGGHFTDQSTLLAACDSDASCVSYQWSEVASSGWKCSTTNTRADSHNEVIFCAKPAPPPAVSYTHLTLPTTAIV